MSADNTGRVKLVGGVSSTDNNRGLYQDIVNGAAHVSPQNSSSWIWPNTLSKPHSGTAANVNAGTTVFDSGDVSMFYRHEFSIVTAPGASSVQILISHDGTNFETVPIEVINRALVVGAVVQSLAQLTAIGNYYFDAKIARFKLANTGATTGASCVARGSSSVI